MKIECPGCFTDVIPMADNRCPSCVEPLSGANKSKFTKVTILSNDVHAAVAGIPFSYWLEHRDQYMEFQRVVRIAIERLRSEEYITLGNWQLISQLESAISSEIKAE